MEEFNNTSDMFGKYKNHKVLSKKFITQHEITRHFYVYKSLAYFMSLKENSIYNHEVIMYNKPRKFFVDLDGLDIDPDECKLQQAAIIKIVKQLFAVVYNVIMSDNNLVIIDSSGNVGEKYKYSVNVVFDGYAMPDYTEFKWFGKQVVEQYNVLPNKITGFLDENFFKREYIGSYICSRMPNCTKNNETRFKRIVSKHEYENGMISHVEGCKMLKPKSPINRAEAEQKHKKKSNIDITDSWVRDTLDITKHLWENSFNYRCSSNSDTSLRIEFDRYRPSYCELCDEVHHTDNTLILERKGNTIYEYCRQSKKSKCVYTDYKFIDKGTTPTKVKKPRDPGTPTLEYDKMFPEDKNIYLIRAAMKMGKTKECIKYIENTSPKYIVLISFRRTFSHEMKEKYKTFELYSDIKSPEINMLNHPRIIIQVESLYRISYKSPPIDLLVLDEIESIWSQFSSGNLRDYYGTLNTFSFLAIHSKKIIAMDANLSKRTFRLLKYLRENFDEEYNYYSNNFNPSSEYKYYFVNRLIIYHQVYGYLVAGKKIMIMTNSLNEAQNICGYVKTRLKDIRCKLYSSKMVESKKTKHFRDVEHYWKKYDLIICTPTVSAGISFESEYIDYVFGVFTSKSCNVETCLQMLGRVRNVKEKTIYLNITGDPRPNDEFPCDPEYIKTHMIYHRQQLITYAKGYGIENLQYEIRASGIDYYNCFAFELVAENIAFDNLSKNNFYGRMKKYIENGGSPVQIITNPEQLGITKRDIENTEGIKNATTKVVKENNIDKVYNAIDITREEYNKLKLKSSKCEDINKHERRAMDKFKITSTLNVEHTSKELIKTFMKNYTLQKFRRTKSLLSGDPKGHVQSDINTMNNYIYSGTELGDATAKYYSVTNRYLTDLFRELPFTIKLHDLFIGTRLFSYCYKGEDMDAAYIRYWDENLIRVKEKMTKLLNMHQEAIPKDMDSYNCHDLLHLFKKVLISNYWLKLKPDGIVGGPDVIFVYNNEMYLEGVQQENNDNGYPVILINQE